MGFFARRVKIDVDLLGWFEDWLSSSGKFALYAMVLCPTKDLYQKFLSANARYKSPALASYTARMATKVAQMEKALAQKGVLPSGGLSDDMIVASKSTKPFMAALRREADFELEKLFQKFLKSSACKAEVLKAIKKEKLAASYALPNKAENDLVPVVIRMKTYEDTEGKKILAQVFDKYDKTSVKDAKAMWEARIRKNKSKALKPVS